MEICAFSKRAEKSEIRRAIKDIVMFSHEMLPVCYFSDLVPSSVPDQVYNVFCRK